MAVGRGRDGTSDPSRDGPREAATERVTNPLVSSVLCVVPEHNKGRKTLSRQ